MNALAHSGKMICEKRQVPSNHDFEFEIKSCSKLTEGVAPLSPLLQLLFIPL